MPRILWIPKKVLAGALAHADSRDNHKKCMVTGCPWGYSNVKHRPHSGGVGRPARRKYLAVGLKYRKAPAKEKK